MIEHTAPISGVASFKDTYVSTAGYDNQVILWDAQSKIALGRGTHDHLANQCRFSNDGSYLVSSSSDHTARVWEVPSMKLTAVLGNHEDDVESIAITDDNEHIATCSRDHKIRVFNRQGELKRVLEGHSQDVISVEWIQNTHEIISSSDDGTVRRWNGSTGELLENIDLGGVETDTVVISKNGVIYAANDDGEILAIYRGRTYKTPAHKAGIKRLVYSKDTNALVSLSYDRSVKVWEITNTHDLSLAHTTAIPSVIWPRSCCFIGINQLAFATFGSCYATFNLNTKEWDLNGVNPTSGINAVIQTELQILTVGDAGLVKSNKQVLQSLPSLCNFFVDFNGYILTGGQSGEIFNAETGKMIYQHHSPLNCGSSYFIDGVPFVAIGAYTGEVIVLSLDDNAEVYYVETVLIQDNAIKGICNDGRSLFSVSATGQAAIHSLRGLEPINFVPQGHSKISNGCVTLNENMFASVSRDLKLRIWNIRKNAVELSHVVDTPHEFSIKCIAALPEKNVIATGSYGGMIALFNYEKNRWVEVIRPTTAGISSICAMSDRSSFLASSYDGELHSVIV